MDKITICDLELLCRVGVPDDERATPQRLLVTVDMFKDLAAAADSDDLSQTVDYHAVVRRLLALGAGREWRLIERLAGDIAGVVLAEFGVGRVRVEVKKFILPETRWVAVELLRRRA